MAISRILTCGFEVDVMTYNHNGALIGYEVDFYEADTAAYSRTTLPRTGTYSLGADAGGYAIFDWTPALTQLQLSFAINRPTWARSGSDDPLMFALGDSANKLGLSLHMNTSEELEARTNDVARDTYAHSLVANRWYHFGVDIKIHTTTGWFYVWLDGVEILNYTGQTDHLVSSVNTMYLNNEAASSNTWATGTSSWDDLYVNNSEGEGSEAAPDDVRLYYIRPDGNGNYSQWTGSDGDTTNNYQLVDEATRPDHETTRLTDSTTSNKDSWTMEDVTVPEDATINAVIPTLVARNAGTGTGQVKTLTRYSATDVLSSAITMEYDYALVQSRSTTKPGGGAWDLTAVNGMEIGVEMQ